MNIKNVFCVLNIDTFLGVTTMQFIKSGQTKEVDLRCDGNVSG